MTLRGIIVMILVILTYGDGGMRDCGINEKFEDGQCKPCPSCDVGHGLRKDCGFGHGAGVHCQPCPPNTYNHDPDERRCLPCTNCTIYNRQFTYRCRPQVNAECGQCLHGFFDAYKELGESVQVPCKSCSVNPSNEDCVRYNKHGDQQSTTHLEIRKISHKKKNNAHMGATVAAVVAGLAFLLLLPAFLCLLCRYKKMQRWKRQTQRGYGSGSQSDSSTMGTVIGIEGNSQGLGVQDKCTLWTENHNRMPDPKPSTSGFKLMQQNVKTKLKKEGNSLQKRAKVTPIDESDSVVSHVAVKDSSSSSGDSPMSTSDAENDDTDITFSDTMSLLDEQKSKSNSLKSDSSKAPSSPLSSTVNLNANGTAKYNRSRKKVPRSYHRSVSEQDSQTEETGVGVSDIDYGIPNERDILCANEIPQAEVHGGRTVAAPSAPPASYVDDGDVHEMETLLIRSCDVDDVASLANHPSLASNYSQATTVPIRSMCPADGVNDLLSLDTMSDNLLFPALVAEPHINQNNLSESKTAKSPVAPQSSRRGDVDSCPDFGLGVPNIQNDDPDLGLIDDFLRPPPAPSMDHIRQLLRYELPLPNLRGCSREVGSNTTERRVPMNGEPADGNTEVKEPYPCGSLRNNEPSRIWMDWNDTERELFDAENDAEVLYKMVKTLDGERYAKALRVAAERQISGLNYEVQEQVSLALNSRGIAGDRNYFHLALRLGIPEDVIRNLPGMMEVFGHLKMRRVTIGELLRTLRVMERHDVVNMISSAILDTADCFIDPNGDVDNTNDDEESVLGVPQQEHGSFFEKEFPYPVQECIA